jgi:hypothetical protein
VIVEDEEIDENENTEPSSPPTLDMVAFRENGALMARWGRDTQTLLMKEFIGEHHLFADFNAFLRKRLR